MELVFVCPEQNRVFECGDYQVINNNGVITDDAGNKFLDAKVSLNTPCPFCGRKHVYHINELSCPFS